MLKQQLKRPLRQLRKDSQVNLWLQEQRSLVRQEPLAQLALQQSAGTSREMRLEKQRDIHKPLQTHGIDT
jgi:hypothetical protein